MVETQCESRRKVVYSRSVKWAISGEICILNCIVYVITWGDVKGRASGFTNTSLSFKIEVREG